MKFNFIELIKSAFTKRDQKFRQRLWIFLICLMISIFVWLTVKLDDEYQQIIPIPVEFIDSPKSKVLVESSDSVIYVELNEKGSELLRYRYLKMMEPLKVSTRNILLSTRAGRSTGIILTSSLVNNLGYQHDLAGKVVSISPDTIFLTFKKEMSRKVPVTANLEIETQKQFMIYGDAIYEPDSVVIIGPEDILSGISSASLGTIRHTQVDEGLSMILPVNFDKHQKFLTASPPEVDVTIPVEKFTEASIEVPITVISDTSLNIKLFPESVTVSYLVALKDYAQVTSGLFLITADFRGIDMEREKKIRVRAEDIPKTIKINRIEPDRVEFITIK